MRRFFMVTCFLVSMTCCSAQGTTGKMPVDANVTDEIHARVTKLEQRIRELESTLHDDAKSVKKKVRAQVGSQAPIAKRSREQLGIPSPARMRSVYWFPPQIWSSASPGQKPLPTPPPRGDVPDSWQEINYFGQWYYLVPMDKPEITPATNK